MYAIMKLSGQEYVDEYAQRAKISVALPRRHRGPADAGSADGQAADGQAADGQAADGRTGDGTPREAGPQHAGSRAETAAVSADEPADE
jgi:hypothetical protein